MDAWPSYCHERTSSSEKAKGKARAKDERLENPWRYPVVEHGSLSAATLKKKGRRLEWTFATRGQSKHKLVASGASVQVFPPTRPKPWRPPKATESQRSEQGAHFLRTCYPDVDVQAELIRDQIMEDTRATQQIMREDPYAGNLIDVSSFHVARKNLAYLAFPMGETNCQLNMSPLVVHSKTIIDLKPTATPVYSFDTPIRQIIASPHVTDVGKGKGAPTLAVRTMGATTLLQVNLAIDRTMYRIAPIPLITVRRSDIGDKGAVDMAISPFNSCMGYVVNSGGDIFRCSAPQSNPVIEQVHVGTPSERPFYRIAASHVRESVLSITDKAAKTLDTRAGKNSHMLHSLTRPQAVFTSIESLSDDRIIRLVSTDEILWLDERNTRKPLLAVKHGRNHDTTLQSFTRVMISSPVTFLTSRGNSLVTVYDVSRGNDNLVYLHDAPYSLPPVIRPDGAHLGHAFFQQPTALGSKYLSVFQLSGRGSVSLLNFQAVSGDSAAKDTASQDGLRTEWPPEVKKLGDDADAARPDLGHLAGRAHMVVDLQPAYEKMFMDRDEPDLVAQTDAVYDTLERMPTFWQNTDVLVEHCLTTFDVAARSGPDPDSVSRNDWFTGSVLDSAPGHRALSQGRLPHAQLVRNTPWHLDIASFVRRIVPELEESAQSTLEKLSRYDLSDDSGRTAASFRRENEARSQLALDLSLACDTYAHKRPGKGTTNNFEEDLLNISRSTEAMSLGDLDPSPVQFSFLRPLVKSDPRGLSFTEEGEVDSVKTIAPLGVRLLLQEWDIGTDPYEYVYCDPYDETAESANRIQRPAKPALPKDAPTIKETGPPTQTQIQRPPAIASSTVARGPPPIAASQPTAPRKPLIAARSHGSLVSTPQRALPSGSQPLDAQAVGPPPPSQEFMASTQVLPGPHGGRPAPAKKKPVKKRVGGF
ncbi:hypothetical protein GY45DRAFT_1296833 [Cubamyces sp. BRFM 1775]|nr:hypothetical protein GY45DRAFT_1296833 [Cubamyces sp. BRFM 1775]